MTKDEALVLALEALESCDVVYTFGNGGYQQFDRLSVDTAITAIKQALAAPVQEPVAQCMEHGECFGGKCIYTTPPQRTWVKLTDKEAMQICEDCGCLSEDWLVLLDAIEAKLKEKNT